MELEQRRIILVLRFDKALPKTKIRVGANDAKPMNQLRTLTCCGICWKPRASRRVDDAEQGWTGEPNDRGPASSVVEDADRPV